MRFKIHGTHTTKGEPLCPSCSHSFVRKGAAQGDEDTLCNVFYEDAIPITYPVIECNRYNNRDIPSLSEMNKIAWFITSDRRTGKVGFIHASKADEELKAEVHDAVG